MYCASVIYQPVAAGSHFWSVRRLILATAEAFQIGEVPYHGICWTFVKLFLKNTLRTACCGWEDAVFFTYERSPCRHVKHPYALLHKFCARIRVYLILWQRTSSCAVDNMHDNISNHRHITLHLCFFVCSFLLLILYCFDCIVHVCCLAVTCHHQMTACLAFHRFEPCSSPVVLSFVKIWRRFSSYFCWSLIEPMLYPAVIHECLPRVTVEQQCSPGVRAVLGERPAANICLA